MSGKKTSPLGILIAFVGFGLFAAAGSVLAIFAAFSGDGAIASCIEASNPTGSIPVSGAGGGTLVGATEYGGPGDPTSGTVGSSGLSLLTYPDSYAELGGTTFQTADALGDLPYGTALRITYGNRSVIAYKRDIGLGGGPVDGHPRVIDLWWQLASALRIPYEDGRWSGLVRIEQLSSSGTGSVLETDLISGSGTDSGSGTGSTGADDGGSTTSTVKGCPTIAVDGVGLTSGPDAELESDGQALAPASAPASVKGIIAAGNEIVGKPYVYGGGHGIPLDEIAAAYDCSSSVAHLLWGGGLLPASADLVAADFETWGEPGPGRWVTIYASASHVFMYVAGLRWDTHNTAGASDGSTGIGWHPLVREDTGFVVRHPAGL